MVKQEQNNASVSRWDGLLWNSSRSLKTTNGVRLPEHTSWLVWGNETSWFFWILCVFCDETDRRPFHSGKRFQARTPEQPISVVWFYLTAAPIQSELLFPLASQILWLRNTKHHNLHLWGKHQKFLSHRFVNKRFGIFLCCKNVFSFYFFFFFFWWNTCFLFVETLFF